MIGNVSSNDVSGNPFGVTDIVVTSLTVHTEFADAGTGTGGLMGSSRSWDMLCRATPATMRFFSRVASCFMAASTLSIVLSLRDPPALRVRSFRG